jgi:2,3-dihydroxybenzoate decarboxylase
MAVLRLGLDELGADRIMFAADFPYEDDAEAVRFIDGAAVTDEQRRNIHETNALRIFKLQV